MQTNENKGENNMKKVISIVLVIVLASITVLSLSSCGKIELTTENIKDYLSFSGDCDSNVDTDTGAVLGIYYKNYKGTATADIKITNQTSKKFENVNLTLRLSNMTFETNEKGPICGWEFTNGNVQEGTSGADRVNYKTVNVALPNDGNWSSKEYLELVLYTEWSSMLWTPSELDSVSVSVIDVSGYVVG